MESDCLPRTKGCFHFQLVCPVPKISSNRVEMFFSVLDAIASPANTPERSLLHALWGTLAQLQKFQKSFNFFYLGAGGGRKVG